MRTAATATGSTTPSGRIRSAMSGSNWASAQRTRRLAHTAHLQPVAQQHNIDEQRHFQKNPLAGSIPSMTRLYTNATLMASAISTASRGRRLRISGPAILEKRDAAHNKDDDRKTRPNAAAAWELRHGKAKPHLDHVAVE